MKSNLKFPISDDRWKQASLALALAALPFAGAGCGARGGEKAAQADTRPRAVPVTVAPIERRTVERTVEAVGTLRGWEDVTVGTKKRGRVVKVLHDIGDRIAPGEPLVELDAVDADLAVVQAEKQLAADLAKLGLTGLPSREFDVAKVPAVVQARVSLDRARVNLERQRTLSQRHAGTQQDLQNAENDEQAAQAGLENAGVVARATLAVAQASKAALDVARQARADMVIRAPVPSKPPGGRAKPVAYLMWKRSASEGQMLGESDPVASLVMEDPLRLWANIPERFAADVAVGQAARIHVSAYPDRAFAGKVARINPAVETTSRTFFAEVAIPNPEGLLRPGGFAKASILTRTDSLATIVPVESVIRFAGVTKLFVVENKVAHAIAVETGQEGSGWVEVFGKVPAADPIITSGQAQLAEGTPVVVREPKSSLSQVNTDKPR